MEVWIHVSSFNPSLNDYFVSLALMKKRLLKHRWKKAKILETFSNNDFFSSSQAITTQCHVLTQLGYIAVENIVRKREIACSKQFLIFSQCVLPFIALILNAL